MATRKNQGTHMIDSHSGDAVLALDATASGVKVSVYDDAYTRCMFTTSYGKQHAIELGNALYLQRFATLENGGGTVECRFDNDIGWCLSVRNKGSQRALRRFALAGAEAKRAGEYIHDAVGHDPLATAPPAAAPQPPPPKAETPTPTPSPKPANDLDWRDRRIAELEQAVKERDQMIAFLRQQQGARQ